MFNRFCWHINLTALSSNILIMDIRIFRFLLIVLPIAIQLYQTFVHCTIFITAASLESYPCFSVSVVGHTFISTMDLRLGRLLLYQLTNPVLAPLISFSLQGLCIIPDLRQIPIFYSPVRHNFIIKIIRLACVIPIASIYPVLILNTITFVELRTPFFFSKVYFLFVFTIFYFQLLFLIFIFLYYLFRC